jgi:hypothetical protein
LRGRLAVEHAEIFETTICLSGDMTTAKNSA